MRIYTRTGDAGETGLLGGGRVPKDHPRIEAIGAVDELNAQIGLIRCHLTDNSPVLAAINRRLDDIQHQLFDCGAELASPDGARQNPPQVTANTVAELERAIDHFEATLSPLREFILPGGSPAAALIHVARVICRRAERRLVTLGLSQPIRSELIQYLNRLGDLLFVLARAANQAAEIGDVLWRK